MGRKALADQLGSLSGLTPYGVLGETDVAHVKFEQTDPLPLVKARVNNSDEVYLLIDTGAPTLMLAPEFAQSVGVRKFGPPETGRFAGGRTAPVHRGTIDSIQLGEFKITHVPVSMREGPRLPMGRRIDGIIGTALLYHFVSTLDYPDGELVLRRKTKEVRDEMDAFAQAPGVHTAPFWMAGTHFMVAWGRVNEAEPRLFFADTGLAGGGFLCPESTIKAAGIACIIAESFARIFFRNAFNTGLPIFESTEAARSIQEGDMVSIEGEIGKIVDKTTGDTFAAAPIPPFMKNLINAGGLMPYVLKKVKG